MVKYQTLNKGVPLHIKAVVLMEHFVYFLSVGGAVSALTLLLRKALKIKTVSEATLLGALFWKVCYI